MRTILICVILVQTLFLKAATSANYVEKYNFTSENALQLPTDFAGHIIVDDSQLSFLKGKKIYHIDLVYTRYKSSPDFDQEKLNQNRVEQLKNLVPQIKVDNPNWSYIEQTGATTKEIAKTYYHGFVIHYSEPLEYSNLNEFFEPFQNSFTQYEVVNSEGAELKYTSGTTIHVSENSVTYSNGKSVVGNYVIEYREYRNQAEIALSGIPMTFQDNQTEYNFSSVGMYEIKAYQNGEELILQKPVTVDFNCTKVDKGVSFYQMNDVGDWQEIHEVNFNQENANEGTSVDDIKFNQEGINQIELNKNDVVPLVIRQGSMHVSTKQYRDKYWETEWCKDSWFNYQQIKSLNSGIFDTIVVSEVENKRMLKIEKGTSKSLIDIVFYPWKYLDKNLFIAENIGNENLEKENNINATLLAEGADAGHTYPSLVKGLNSPSFGVYNCDQIYRIGQPLALKPTYVDNATNKEISKKYVTCVLDLTFNGSFSFQPNNIMCNPDGRNVILLFTEDKKVYLLNENEFENLDVSSPEVELSMTNVTDQVRNSNDLKELLNL